MKSTLCVLFALSSLAAFDSAQTPGTTQVIVPCTQPAPAGSIVPQTVLPLTYVDPNNVVVMEMESQQPIGDWVEESIVSGYGGDSYFRWNGPNLFGTPNVDTLTFNFELSAADTYVIRMHVRHDNPDWTEGNDCWVRLDGGTWEKVYNNTGPGSVGVWSFDALYDDTDSLPIHDLDAGTHTFEVSGRSTDFLIDRIHVLPTSIFQAQLSDPQSDVLRARPIIGQTMKVEIDDPQDTFGMTPGVARTAWYVGLPGSSYPCGRPTQFGELLITGPGGGVRLGAFKTWMGPGQPNVHKADIPNNINLVGMTFISQAIMVQPTKLRYAEGLEITIGDI